MQAYHSYPPRYCGTSPLYPEYDDRLNYTFDATPDNTLDVTPDNTLDVTPNGTLNTIQAAPLPRHLRWCRWGR